jgi:2-polyprenyl-3-methyl-5-hydroxy-6-metoxy-1,4-benzoquinol methylase
VPRSPVAPTADSAVGSCPVCGGAVDRQADLRWRKDGHDIVDCRSCGLLFRADLPTDAELASVYGPAYFSSTAGDDGGQGYPDYLEEELNHRANAIARLEMLERTGGDGRLLDVGCAAGFFLDEARKLGWLVEGVELAAEMASYGRNMLGLPIRASAFSDVELEPHTFDAVTMWDYIEHSTNPVGDLGHARDLLRPGGLLALTTGDASSVAARVCGQRWHLMTPRHHNFFFTRKSLLEALRATDFQILSIAHASSRYSASYLLHKLRTLHDSSLLRTMADRLRRGRLGRLSVPINLYDIFTVIAERR